MSEKLFITKDKSAYTINPSIPPVLKVQAPCTVTFETDDVAYRRLAGGESVEEIGMENFNMVTGPVYVEGVEPGDVLRLEVIDVTVSSAWSVWIPGFGRLGRYTDHLQMQQIELEGEWAIISESLRVPLEPMIGCIAVAPPEGSSSTLRPAYPWGGNMDLRELSPGTVIYLPVQVPGGLVFVGDLHAAMGTGEPTSVSLEAAGQATIGIVVEKSMTLAFPRLREGESTICIGIGENIKEAKQIAYDQVYALLVEEYGLEPFEAYAYASARVGLRFGGPASAIVLAVVPDIDS